MSDAVDNAVDIVARGILARLIDTFEWEDYPEVGEHDWLRIIERAQEITAEPPDDVHMRAYVLLTMRAADGVTGQ